MERSAMDPWSLTLLGGFELRPPDGAPADLLGQKDRALVAVLAMAAGRPHSRERLAGLLWSEYGDRQARDSLKQALVRLRRCLGGGEGGVLRADRQSVALDPAAIQVDVLAFERLAAAGGLDSLAQATAIYRGDLLEGIAIRDPAFEVWLLVERQRLCQLFERALAGLMSQALAGGDREGAAEAARHLLQRDPLSEAAYRTLMQVHADEAQAAQALKLYEALRERLYREFGVAPESATVALYDRIRRRRTTSTTSADQESTPGKVASLPCEREARAGRATTTARAHEYYLMGRSFCLRGTDKHNQRIARGMFSRAGEVDPSCARAYAGMAICDFYLAMSDPNGSFDSAVDNANRALALDPDLAEAYAAKGLALYAGGDYGAANAEFERALSCDANSFEAHFFYARNCRLQGLHRDAAALFERASALRPNDFRSLGLLASAYRSLGRRAEARAASQRCLQRIEIEIELRPDNADALAFGSVLLAELGHAAQAEDWAARALMIGPDDHLVHYSVARTYALLGKSDAALPRLHRAFGTSSACRRRLAAWMRQDEKIDPLRGDPRFQALVQHLAHDAEAR